MCQDVECTRNDVFFERNQVNPYVSECLDSNLYDSGHCVFARYTDSIPRYQWNENAYYVLHHLRSNVVEKMGNQMDN